jgi:hypothetical protein
MFSKLEKNSNQDFSNQNKFKIRTKIQNLNKFQNSLHFKIFKYDF